jgi:hypothetical protein
VAVVEFCSVFNDVLTSVCLHFWILVVVSHWPALNMHVAPLLCNVFQVYSLTYILHRQCSASTLKLCDLLAAATPSADIPGRKSGCEPSLSVASLAAATTAGRRYPATQQLLPQFTILPPNRTTYPLPALGWMLVACWTKTETRPHLAVPSAYFLLLQQNRCLFNKDCQPRTEILCSQLHCFPPLKGPQAITS